MSTEIDRLADTLAAYDPHCIVPLDTFRYALTRMGSHDTLAPRGGARVDHMGAVGLGSPATGDRDGDGC